MGNIVRENLTRAEAKEIVSACYEADRSGGMFQHGNKDFGFAGSVITATATYDKETGKYTVDVYSGWYEDVSLELIID